MESKKRTLQRIHQGACEKLLTPEHSVDVDEAVSPLLELVWDYPSRDHLNYDEMKFYFNWHFFQSEIKDRFGTFRVFLFIWTSMIKSHLRWKT